MSESRSDWISRTRLVEGEGREDETGKDSGDPQTNGGSYSKLIIKLEYRIQKVGLYILTTERQIKSPSVRMRLNK